MKTITISLGGSVIIPAEVNFSFLDKFKKVVENNLKNYKFVIVCGGGSIARKYIEALKNEKKSLKEQDEAGIRATRMNALFMMQFFGKESNRVLPRDMKEVKNLLKKHRIVICGALRHEENATSDSTTASLSNLLDTYFVNITNVRGLYTADPKKDKNAVFIKNISWKDFDKIAEHIKFKAGQHFVLDQKAAKLINKHKIKTFIIGPDMSQLDKILKGKDFDGTLINGNNKSR